MLSLAPSITWSLFPVVVVSNVSRLGVVRRNRGDIGEARGKASLPVDKFAEFGIVNYQKCARPPLRNGHVKGTQEVRFVIIIAAIEGSESVMCSFNPLLHCCGS